MRVTQITPAVIDKIQNRWIAVIGKSRRRLRNSVADQKALARTGYRKYFRYVGCPICGKEDYGVLHPRTLYNKRRSKDLVLHALVSILGRERAANFIAALLRTRPAFINRGYLVARCTNCDFTFRNPTYTERGLERAYNSGTYVNFLTGQYSKTRTDLYDLVYKESEFEKFSEGFERRRLFDLGCGFGLFLDFMRTKGWEGYGVDFAEDSIRFGIEHFGLANIAPGNLEHDSFEPGFFDAVSLISVIAHLVDPMDMLSRIARVLRPGGLLLIWTVNADSFNHRVALSGWGGFTPNHVIFFDRASIRQALDRGGFDIVKVGYDYRRIENLASWGLIEPQHEATIRESFVTNGLGDMLLVLARKR